MTPIRGPGPGLTITSLIYRAGRYSIAFMKHYGSILAKGTMITLKNDACLHTNSN